MPESDHTRAFDHDEVDDVAAPWIAGGLVLPDRDGDTQRLRGHDLVWKGQMLEVDGVDVGCSDRGACLFGSHGGRAFEPLICVELAARDHAHDRRQLGFQLRQPLGARQALAPPQLV
jgi:hypothetical protein